MRSMRAVLCFANERPQNVDKFFNVLGSHYEFQTIALVGVVGSVVLNLNGTVLNNLPPESVHLLNYDYVIVLGLDAGMPSEEIAKAKSAFAEKLNIAIEDIILDFEIYNRTYQFENVCLVVVFNHRFDKNLPLLRRIYGSRFSNIRFLVPFYDGADADVIPVYESSYQFQGYFIQAYEHLKDIPCTHYLFIGDDLILNPNFNELNVINKMSGGSARDSSVQFCITSFSPLNRPDGFRWGWTAGASRPFYNISTVWRGSIPDYNEALSKFNAFFGKPYDEVYTEHFFGDPNKPGQTVHLGSWNNAKEFRNVVMNFIVYENKNSLRIPYPMAGGYSDIFCIRKERLFEFSRLCGVFAAMNMFVEIAIPTAAVLTFRRDEVKFFPTGTASFLWDNDRTALENKYGLNFARLYNDWERKLHFIHPIKLSRWHLGA